MTKTTWLGILIALCVACFLAPLASSLPDGLESVAALSGFAGKEAGGRMPFAFLAGYDFPWVRNDALATALAGLIGVLTVFAVVLSVGYAINKRPERKSS